MWRPARIEEDDRVVELVSALYREDPSDEPVPESSARRTLAAFRADPVRGVAVVLAGAASGVQGYALLVSFWSNELGGEICEIDELYVAAELRGGGYGSALIRSIARGEPPWGRKPAALCLQVTPDNARARALYQRLGFSVWKNAMMMMRDLG